MITLRHAVKKYCCLTKKKKNWKRKVEINKELVSGITVGCNYCILDNAIVVTQSDFKAI